MSAPTLGFSAARVVEINGSRGPETGAAFWANIWPRTPATPLWGGRCAGPDLAAQVATYFRAADRFTDFGLYFSGRFAARRAHSIPFRQPEPSNQSAQLHPEALATNSKVAQHSNRLAFLVQRCWGCVGRHGGRSSELATANHSQSRGVALVGLRSR